VTAQLTTRTWQQALVWVAQAKARALHAYVVDMGGGRIVVNVEGRRDGWVRRDRSGR
jgi:sarcosine oxidase gamma subunit